MRTQKPQRSRAVALILDLAVVAAAFVMAFWVRDSLLPKLGMVEGGLYPLRSYIPLLLPAILIFGSLMIWTGAYRVPRRWSFAKEVRIIFYICLAATALLVVAVFFVRPEGDPSGATDLSRFWVINFGLFAFVFLVVEKKLLYTAARQARTHGYDTRAILIAGSDETALRIARLIEYRRDWGLRVVGFVSQSPSGGLLAGRYPRLGHFDNVVEVVKSHVVDEVIYAVRQRDIDRFEDQLLRLEELGVCTRVCLDWFPHINARLEMGTWEGVPLVTLSTAPSGPFQIVGKRVVDFCCSMALLLLAAPIFGFVAILVKLTSRGDVVFGQTRVGLNGRRFKMYKFRSMVENADATRAELEHLNEMDGPVFKIRQDPRVTPVGRVIRRLSLDELPQLWNVLKGDMSLVGPRPPIPEEVEHYLPWQRRRLSMRPGITCLWQISGRNDVDFDRWMELDLEYIDSWSPLLDLKILLKTLPAVLRGRGAA